MNVLKLLAETCSELVGNRSNAEAKGGDGRGFRALLDRLGEVAADGRIAPPVAEAGAAPSVWGHDQKTRDSAAAGEMGDDGAAAGGTAGLMSIPMLFAETPVLRRADGGHRGDGHQVTVQERGDGGTWGDGRQATVMQSGDGGTWGDDRQAAVMPNTDGGAWDDGLETKVPQGADGRHRGDTPEPMSARLITREGETAPRATPVGDALPADRPAAQVSPSLIDNAKGRTSTRVGPLDRPAGAAGIRLPDRGYRRLIACRLLLPRHASRCASRSRCRARRRTRHCRRVSRR